MNAVCIVLTLLLFPSSVKPMSVSSGQSHLKNGVMKFDEVMRRSYCQPMETMIDILHEYPDEVEHFFRPSCVPLLRCSGCCNDENQECLPTETANITLQVYKYKLRHNAGYEEMSFQQHTKYHENDKNLPACANHARKGVWCQTLTPASACVSCQWHVANIGAKS
ncbi:vascular endothelial growth factor A-like isoform X2 [Petromyzon marinus]|uniref:Vascular endothelial growth factor A-like isoform X2 n=1 Tax=Petromyzon marinus TaxID=7757 RepID=A0AAJ7WX63_PETMA|nr:vascular endothelial growth factor A-like isoform X2 [Petromyzon marinus]